MTHAVAAVMELERFVDAGHNYTKKTTPSVEAVLEKCQLLEELAVRQVKRVNVAHQSMAHESRRLDDLTSALGALVEPRRSRVNDPRIFAGVTGERMANLGGEWREGLRGEL